MNHLRDLNIADIPAILALPAEDPAWNRLAHEMMGIDGPVPEEEAVGAVFKAMGKSLRFLGSVYQRDPETIGLLGRYRREPVDVCRPGPFDPEPIVRAVRGWTGIEAKLWLEWAPHRIRCHIYHAESSFTGQEIVTALAGFRPVHLAHAVIAAGVVACVFYGRAGS